MKTLLLIRHAKSSWDSAASKDFDRPLNERGKKNAPEMASRLLKKKIDIDLFVSSPAKRAKTTAILFTRELEKKEEKIIFDPQLYNADAENFYDVISKLDDKYKSVAIFSHNPGITDFANSLTQVRIDNIPTCGIFGLRIDVENWSGFNAGKKDFIFFDYPKSGAD
jgi:phosphohistidine phosphatase